MSALVATLLGLAAYMAERGSRSIRRGHLDSRWKRPSAIATSRRAVPAMVVWCALSAAAGYAVSGAVAAGLGAAGAAVAWHVRGRRRARSRDHERDAQLVDAVASITAAIRAGQSVPQALSFATSESREPLRACLEHLERDLDLGVPIEDALTSWTLQIDTDDARLLAGVLSLHRRSGGDLPSVLDQVAGTLRERRAAVREVQALTAQARLSGTILGVLPFGFFAFLWLTSRSEIEGAFRSTAGIAAITLGLVLEGLAFLWIRYLLEVR